MYFEKILIGVVGDRKVVSGHCSIPIVIMEEPV